MGGFSTMNAGTPCAVCAYEQAGRAVVLLDRNAKILRMNPAAERLLGSDFKVVSNRFCSVDPKATAALNLALHTLIGSNEPTSVIPPILLPRANRWPLLVYAMRPPTICERARAPCQAVLVLIDPDNTLPSTRIRIEVILRSLNSGGPACSTFGIRRST
jgi:PAS domain-containing protein